MLTLIFGIWASEPPPPRAWRTTEKAGPDRVNGSTSFQPALKELSNKANRALFALNSKHKLSKLPLDIAIKLFDVMISPILLYRSEVWGAYEYNSNQENLHKWDKSPIEAVHICSF